MKPYLLPCLWGESIPQSSQTRARGVAFVPCLLCVGMRCVRSPPRLKRKRCQINSGCSLAAAVFGIFFLNGMAAATISIACSRTFGCLGVGIPWDWSGWRSRHPWMGQVTPVIMPWLFAGMERWVGLGWASPAPPHGTPRSPQLSCHHALAAVGARGPLAAAKAGTGGTAGTHCRCPAIPPQHSAGAGEMEEPCGGSGGQAPPRAPVCWLSIF